MKAENGETGTKVVEWTKEDTAFINALLAENNKESPTSLKELIELHESLPY